MCVWLQECMSLNVYHTASYIAVILKVSHVEVCSSYNCCLLINCCSIGYIGSRNMTDVD